MVLHNPNNWHWVMKDAGQWAKDYLDTECKKLSAEEDGVTAQITKLVSMDGDVEVSQRKGKVITIFDVVLQLEYEGAKGSQSAVRTPDAHKSSRQDSRRHRCQW
jgi:activator of HSP90 ATPase